MLSRPKLADSTLASERQEAKYWLHAGRLEIVRSAIAAHIAPHHAPGHAGSAEQDIATVYFDTQQRAYYALARRKVVSNVKIRAREYFTLSGSSEPRKVFVELKRREAHTTTKQRFSLAKERCQNLFESHDWWTELGVGSIAELPALEAFVVTEPALAKPVGPSVITRHRRLSFQDEQGRLRVTIDCNIAYFALPTRSFHLAEPLSAEALGNPVHVEPRALVEVKRRGTSPPWLDALLHEEAAPALTFSKFSAANVTIYERKPR
jgi:SPX domain protein involved in polyphosphate accumulation